MYGVLLGDIKIQLQSPPAIILGASHCTVICEFVAPIYFVMGDYAKTKIVFWVC